MCASAGACEVKGAKKKVGKIADERAAGSRGNESKATGETKNGKKRE